MKVAIVCDWLVGGGAERVVEEIHKLYPDAPIYTSYASPQWRSNLHDKVVTGYLQHWPFSSLRKFLPVLRQRWFRSLDLSSFDLVISSSGNGEAKFVKVPKTALHICYCHSPTHFYWRHYHQYLEQPGFGIFNPLGRLGLKLLVGPLRKRDFQAAQKPDYYIANSSHIQADIKKYYGRSSKVIFPPVEVELFSKFVNSKRQGFVALGRQVPYKRFDLVVRACSSLNLPLTVVGQGPEHKNLQKLASPNVKFKAAPSRDDVARAMGSAQAFLFAANEDFGVTPVEAMAAGTPVIAYRSGGAVDYVVDGKTGLFFDEQTVDSITAAIERFNAADFNHRQISQAAKKFSAQNFRKQFLDFVSSCKIKDN